MCNYQNILFLCPFFGVCVCDVTKSNMMETPQTQATGGKIRITWEQMCKYMCFGHTSIKHQLLQVSAAAAAKLLQSCPTLCDPIDGTHQAPPSLGFSRQEHWSGLPFPSPIMKVKSESEVAQSCSTLHDPMDCNLPGSSGHGIFQARVLEWGAIAFSFFKFLKELISEWKLKI